MAKYNINFESVKDKTLGEIFGTEPKPVSEINQIMKTFISENNLSDKPPKTPLQIFSKWWNRTDWKDITMKDYCEHAETIGIKKADKKRVSEIFTKFNNDVLDEDFQVVFNNFHKKLVKAVRDAEK